MAKKNKTPEVSVRNVEVTISQSLISNELYTVHFVGEDFVMEFRKTMFRGVGRPKVGDTMTFHLENERIAKIFLNGVQFCPSLHPLSAK